MRTEFETLLYREENGVAYVTLNRPEVQNSFDYVMIDELAELWQGLRSHATSRSSASPSSSRPCAASRFCRSRTCDGMSVAHTITTSCWFAITS